MFIYSLQLDIPEFPDSDLIIHDLECKAYYIFHAIMQEYRDGIITYEEFGLTKEEMEHEDTEYIDFIFQEKTNHFKYLIEQHIFNEKIEMFMNLSASG